MTTPRRILFSVIALVFPLPVSISAAQALSAATVDASVAVAAVSNAFTPNPLVLVESTGKPLASTGSWGLLRHFPDPAPAGCQKDGTVCVKVLYRVPEDKIVCSWIVGFVPADAPATANPSGGPQGTASDKVEGPHAVIFAENDAAAQYTLKKSWAKGDVPFRGVKTVAASYPSIARSSRVSGVVVVRVIVDPNGHVQNVAPLGGPEMLQPAAIDAAKQWQFEPVLVGDRKTSFRIDIPFNFGLNTPSVTQGMGQGGVMIVQPHRPGQEPIVASPTGAVSVQCGATGCSPVGPAH